MRVHKYEIVNPHKREKIENKVKQNTTPCCRQDVALTVSLHVHGFAKEQEGRRRRRVAAAASSAAFPVAEQHPLIVIHAKQRQRQLHLVAAPDSPRRHAAFVVRLAELAAHQHGADARHVEAPVAAEREHDGSHAVRRARHVAEAEALPQRVVPGNGAPQPAHARRHAEGRAVQHLQDLYKHVHIVVNTKLAPLVSIVFF